MLVKLLMGKKLSLEEYLEIEKRHIDCAFDIITQSQCKYLTIGYVADYDNIGYRYKDRIPVERVESVLKDVLRVCASPNREGYRGILSCLYQKNNYV